MPRTELPPRLRLPTFTEEDLAPAPRRRISASPLHKHRSHDDILVALQAVTASPSPAPLSNPLLDLSFSTPPSRDVLAAHLLSNSSSTPSSFHHSRQRKHPPEQPSPVSTMPVDNIRLPCNRRTRKQRSRRPAPSPSRFCHICARTQKSNKVFCANLHTEKKCRKAVCELCFRELGWSFEHARDSGTWICPHCRGICGDVPRARCHIYTKTNEKRKAVREWGR